MLLRWVLLPTTLDRGAIEGLIGVLLLLRLESLGNLSWFISLMIALSTLYGLVAAALVLLGSWIALWKRISHRGLEIALSFVSGVMLGVAFFDLLPHALEGFDGPVSEMMCAVLVGFLTLFLLERFFCFHHHDIDVPGGDYSAHHSCNHSHRFTWSGAALGLSVHSIIGGMILAASIYNESLQLNGISLTAGLGTFLAVTLHKPFDGFSLATLMRSGQWSNKSILLTSVALGLMLPLGMLIFFCTFSEGLVDYYLLKLLLGFAAGTFLCISLSDLLPELQFHQHDRFKLTLALALGLLLAFSVAKFEHGQHSHRTSPAPADHSH